MGYDIAVVMSDRFASELFLDVQKNMMECFDILQKEYAIRNMNQLRNERWVRDEVVDFFEEYNEIFLYGAGHLGDFS